MVTYFKKGHILTKSIAAFVCFTVFVSSFTYYIFNARSVSYADMVNVPLTGQLPFLTPQITKNIQHLPVIRGIKFSPDKPFHIDFYFDTMDKNRAGEKDVDRLIKYFLGFLAVPEKDLWVNLSPYEKDRIIPDTLKSLDIGKDLLIEDYLLKQLTSSLTDPKTPQGKNFWKEAHKIAYKIAKTTKVPINTFNKVWIVPGKVKIFEYNNMAFIKQAQLKVMLDEDYVAQAKENKPNAGNGLKPFPTDTVSQINKEAKEVFKRELLPIIEDQVNNGLNFAPLRQLYHSLILATYFKEKLKNHIIYKHYIDQNKTDPIALENPQAKEIIYESYLEGFRKGVYNYIKKEYDPYLKTTVSRRYFSGGLKLDTLKKEMETENITKTEPAQAYQEIDKTKSKKGTWQDEGVDVDSEAVNKEALEGPENQERAKASGKNVSVQETVKTSLKGLAVFGLDIPWEIVIIGVLVTAAWLVWSNRNNIARFWVKQGVKNKPKTRDTSIPNLLKQVDSILKEKKLGMILNAEGQLRINQLISVAEKYFSLTAEVGAFNRSKQSPKDIGQLLKAIIQKDNKMRGLNYDFVYSENIKQKKTLVELTFLTVSGFIATIIFGFVKAKIIKWAAGLIFVIFTGKTSQAKTPQPVKQLIGVNIEKIRGSDFQFSKIIKFTLFAGGSSWLTLQFLSFLTPLGFSLPLFFPVAGIIVMNIFFNVKYNSSSGKNTKSRYLDKIAVELGVGIGGNLKTMTVGAKETAIKTTYGNITKFLKGTQKIVDGKVVSTTILELPQADNIYEIAYALKANRARLEEIARENYGVLAQTAEEKRFIGLVRKIRNRSNPANIARTIETNSIFNLQKRENKQSAQIAVLEMNGNDIVYALWDFAPGSVSGKKIRQDPRVYVTTKEALVETLGQYYYWEQTNLAAIKLAAGEGPAGDYERTEIGRAIAVISYVIRGIQNKRSINGKTLSEINRLKQNPQASVSSSSSFSIQPPNSSHRDGTNVPAPTGEGRIGSSKNGNKVLGGVEKKGFAAEKTLIRHLKIIGPEIIEEELSQEDDSSKFKKVVESAYSADNKERIKQLGLQGLHARKEKLLNPQVGAGKYTEATVLYVSGSVIDDLPACQFEYDNEYYFAINIDFVTKFGPGEIYADLSEFFDYAFKHELTEEFNNRLIDSDGRLKKLAAQNHWKKTRLAHFITVSEEVSDPANQGVRKFHQYVLEVVFHGNKAVYQGLAQEDRRVHTAVRKEVVAILSEHNQNTINSDLVEKHEAAIGARAKDLGGIHLDMSKAEMEIEKSPAPGTVVKGADKKLSSDITYIDTASFHGFSYQRKYVDWADNISAFIGK